MTEHQKPDRGRGVQGRIVQLERNLLDSLELPAEALANVTRLTILGRERLRVENHRGIKTYSAGLITLAVPEGELKIEGRDLVIRSILPEEIQLEGKLLSVGWSEPGGS